jgi:hypothetical protein
MNLAITLLAGGGCTFDTVEQTFKTAKTHGIVMWFTWTLVGVAQIWTGRYLVHWWRWRQFVHSTLGGLMGVLTIAGVVLILKFLNFKFLFNHLHTVAGMVCALLGLLLVLGGIFALV